MSTQNYVITTDTTCDLPIEYVKEHIADVHPIFINMDGEIKGGYDIDCAEFYQKMREGKEITTMASNLEDVQNAFRKQLEQGLDILHISFSSALSSTFSNTTLIAQEIMEEFPGRTIKVVDSMSASMGQGLFVTYACRNRESGMSLEENEKWLLENRCHFCHQFTVDDLNTLHKGGRISKSVAVLGSLINVKPVLYVDDTGHLVSRQNVRGRKKALVALVDNMIERLGNFKNDVIYISHADDLASAEFVRNLVKERTGIDNFVINYICPMIGAHVGPGTVALFSMGETR